MKIVKKITDTFNELKYFLKIKKCERKLSLFLNERDIFSNDFIEQLKKCNLENYQLFIFLLNFLKEYYDDEYEGLKLTKVIEDLIWQTRRLNEN